MKEIVIPDIGGATDVDVIEVLVNVGDSIEKDQSLLTLESDKASMEIPASEAGVIKELKVGVGDKVSQGAVIALIDAATGSQSDAPAQASKPEAAVTETVSEQLITIPDLGTADAVDVIEVSVSEGDEVEKDQTIMTVEGDKASMEVPSPAAGKVVKLLVSVGDKVKSGGDLMQLALSGGTLPSASVQQEVASKPPAAKSTPAPASTKTFATKTTAQALKDADFDAATVYASPSVRRLARELGVNLHRVSGSGNKGRITPDDVRQFVKDVMQQVESGNISAGGSGLSVAPMPEVDFSQFGEIEAKPLNKIKRLTASNLHRNWVTIPHVTQFDEADITELEAFRQSHKKQALKMGTRLTPLVFIMKAVVKALQEFPQFNASLSADGQSLIMKKYYHIGVAADTPNGLVVPVIRDVNQKGALALAKELGDVSEQARTKGLSVAQMSGSCFTISSLGGIGGTAFTPIVNAPDVAILGVSKSQMKPVYKDGEFVARLMLPLSLSYDHRVIDGAEAARFTRFLAECLTDMRTVLL